MTTTTEGQGQTEQPTDEQKKLEAQEAEAGFAAGFNKVRGGEDPAETETTTEAATAQAAPVEEKKAEPAKAAAADPWDGVPAVVKERLESLSALPNRLRNIEGHFGGLKSALDTLNATAKAAAKKGEEAPTETQVQAALADEDSWKKFKEEFPDFAAPVEKQLASVRAELAKRKDAPPVDVKEIESRVSARVEERLAAAMPAATDAAEERAFVRLKHPDWKATVNTPEFKTWTLQGGPSLDAYSQMKALEKTDPTKAEEVVNAFARSYPKWWGEKGAAMFGSTANDAITLLDGFKAHKDQAATAGQAKEKQQKRLDAATPLKSSPAPITRAITDEEAFERGFKRVAKAK